MSLETVVSILFLMTILLLIFADYIGNLGYKPAGVPPPSLSPSSSLKAKICDTIIEYRLHNSLPSEWIDEFHKIMNNVKQHFPADNYSGHNCKYTLIAWKNDANKPYGDYSGQRVTKDKIILEMPSEEFDNQHAHRYAVIVHEYYHVYQLARSGGTDCMWIMEGPAACFESLYMKEYYNYHYFKHQKRLTADVLTSPAEYETYEKYDVNYSNCVFMTLVLHKELVSRGDSNTTAFSKIFKDYWQENIKENWRRRFETIFNFSVESFYSMIANYELDMDKVLPDNYPLIREYAHD